jgi:hypothetical protein
MPRFLTLLLSLLAFGWSSTALADVRMHFHSFNGSLFFGRYPHTFVVLEGALDDGTRVDENYGFSAKRATTAVLRGPVEHMILVEEPKYLTTTNRHFTVTISDAQYRRVRAEMERWRDAPGKFYDLDTRNCIHFVGAMAQIVGLRVDYPDKLLRKPKQWLNRLAAMNPQLGAKPIR